MSRILTAAVLVFAATLLVLPLSGQSQPETPAAPIPAQIAAAKKVFVSNLGEASPYSNNVASYAGGPNRAYNQFYDAMKTWGKYELVSAPAAADLVFEIAFQYTAFPAATRELRLLIVDPKTDIPLWGFAEYVEPAGAAKNREKNLNLAMTVLVNDVKKVATPPAAQPAEK
jgi:hypothetical protein